jgi:hypothetical protein
VSKVGQYFIYAVFVLGILLVLASNDNIGWDDTWVWLSILLYLIAIGFSHGFQQPNAERIVALAEELTAAGPPPEGAQGPPPQVAEIEATSKKLAAGGAFLQLILLAIIALMIFKPGFP